MTDPIISFEKWYVEPLGKLREIPNGDGGFVALAISCFLYERYAKALIKERGEKADTPALVKQLASDFDTDERTATIFWNVIRNGLLHQAMPMARKHGEEPQTEEDNNELLPWQFHSSFDTIAISKVHGQEYLRVEPWKFTDRVMSLWKSNLALLSTNESFPWAQVVPIPFGDLE